ncbi:MAG: type III pantothenate kinase [Lawsonibacter sp.]
MLLAIDIGNTNIVIGGIRDDQIVFEARIATDRIKTSDQYGVDIKNVLSLFDQKPRDIKDCIISSVVPPVFNSVRTGVVKVIGKQPMVVGPGIKTGLNIQMDTPSQVGSDRIVIAVAALAEYEPPLTLLDMGTATTIEVVGKGSTYLGGCIIPGVRVSLDALTSRTAQLPGIRLDKPRKVIGKNTVDCMRSGIMYGTAAMVDGMLERVEEELGFSTTVVATGGMAQFIVPLCRREIRLEKDLLLKGLNILYKKNHLDRKKEEN